MALNLIGYARVSTDEQAFYGWGLDAQETKLREYARRTNVNMTVIRDEGISGKTLERPGLQRALMRIAAREMDGLVVVKLDRLSRSALDFLTLTQWFTDARATLVIMDMDLDTTTPTGKMMTSLMGVLAEFERDLISQRTREGLAAARAKGRAIGPPAVGDRPELADRIRRMREDGCTYQAICDALNADGIPTARGGSVWRPSSVQAVLGYQRRPKRKKVANLPPLSGRR